MMYMWNAEFSVVSFNNFERNFMRFSKVNFCVILWYFKKNILENVEFLSSFPALPTVTALSLDKYRLSLQRRRSQATIARLADLVIYKLDRHYQNKAKSSETRASLKGISAFLTDIVCLINVRIQSLACVL